MKIPDAVPVGDENGKLVKLLMGKAPDGQTFQIAVADGKVLLIVPFNSASQINVQLFTV